MHQFARAACVVIATTFLSACGAGTSNNSITPVQQSAQSAAVASVAVNSPSPNASNGPHSPPPSSTATTQRATASSQYGPAHAPWFEQLAGNFATTQAGWNAVAQNVSMLMTDKRAVTFAHNAGIKVGFYTDPLKISGQYLSSYPAAAFAHSCSGQTVFTGNTSVPAYLGDPGSSALQSTWRSQIGQMLNDQWGSYPYQFAYSDDSDDPGAVWDPSIYRYGGPNGPPAVPVYCNYSQSSWYAHVTNLFNSSQLPVIFNGDTDPKYFAYMQGQKNIIGGECEGCISSAWLPNGQNKVTGSEWSTQMNAGLIDITNQKIFFLSPDGQVSADTLGYTYASYMLMYDQNYTVFRQGGVWTPSGLSNPPTALIVPTQPLVATPSNISSLNFGAGIYAREYAACYIAGKYVGACAALVNPDPNNWHPWPWLSREYFHTLQFGGTGAANNLGDTGWANANGAHPGNGLGPAGWAIAFQ